MIKEAWKEEVRYIPDTPLRIVVDDQISLYRGKLPPHWHDAIEVDYVLNGSIYYVINGVTHHLNEGDTAIVDSGVIHSGRCEDGKTLEETRATVMTLQFNKDVLHYANFDIPIFPAYLSKAENKEMREVLDEIREVYERKEKYHEMLLNSLCLRLCYTLLKQQSPEAKKEVSSITTAEIKDTLQYVEEHCAEKVTLEEVAERINYNPSYFSRMFHQFTGFTFTEYLNRCRTNMAVKMLEETDQSVAEISYACGFPNVSSFITFFKRQYHLTPEKYRKQKVKKSQLSVKG